MSGDERSAQDLIETSDRISKLLGLNYSQDLISSDLNNSISTIHQDNIFGSKGICSGYNLKALPDRYFIAQEFGKESSDLRISVEKAFADFGVESIRADDQYWGGPILCKICSLIQCTPFGVYQLSVSQNRNVVITRRFKVVTEEPLNLHIT